MSIIKDIECFDFLSIHNKIKAQLNNKNLNTEFLLQEDSELPASPILVKTDSVDSCIDIHLGLNKYLDDKNIINDQPHFTKLNISTITAIANIGSELDLDLVGRYIELGNNIRYIKYGTHTRGIPTKKISKKKELKKKIFFNQATFIVRSPSSKFVNVKIFTNGKIQMTGLKNIDDGKIIVNQLISDIQKINLEGTEDANKQIIKNITNFKLSEFKTVLINTDFKTNFKIKRPELHKLLVNDYKLFSKYEPCIYPGVDTKFYCNTIYKSDGLCHCKIKCNGKGYGNGVGDCKKVTVATFQSGSVIITGARNMDQVIQTYEFIKKMFVDNYSKIIKILPFFVLEDEKQKNKKLLNKPYYIKKSLIRNRFVG